MQVGLYSITYLGLWYRGEPLSLEQVIRRAREFGYHGVEIDGKRPHGSPLDVTPRRAGELRRLADGEGVAIYAVAANNDFTSPIPEHREAQVAWVRELIAMTAALGAGVLRVFAAWPGVTTEHGLGRYDVARRWWRSMHESATVEEIWDRCRRALSECARYAADAGVTLALQNHPPVIESYRDMLGMIREVNSPALKACLDAPLLAKYERVPMAEAVRATGALEVLSHFGGEYECDAGGAVMGFTRQPDGSLRREDFYLDFIRALAESGYRGYLGYELCHPLPVVEGETVGVEFAHRNARLAARYMRELISSVERSRSASA